MSRTTFDIDEAIRRVRIAVAPFPKAAMFELADDGFITPFQQLIACLLSIRTRDEVSIVAARRLFATASRPEALADLSPDQIDRLISSVTFHDQKSRQIHVISTRVRDDFGGDLPLDADLVRQLPGIGPKCTNLALGISAGIEAISVDIHVHRITNRWGYVRETTPERTMDALSRVLPKHYWLEINALLVPFGKHVCTGVRPRCTSCVLSEMCLKIGVTEHR